MKDRRRFLKVKLKTLAAEARIIRREEQRTHDPALREALYLHRILKVRRAARNTHLAYGYLRGRSYTQLEASCAEAPDWADVKRMVKQYGGLELDSTVWSSRPILVDKPTPAGKVHAMAGGNSGQAQVRITGTTPMV